MEASTDKKSGLWPPSICGAVDQRGWIKRSKRAPVNLVVCDWRTIYMWYHTITCTWDRYGIHNVYYTWQNMTHDTNLVTDIHVLETWCHARDISAAQKLQNLSESPLASYMVALEILTSLYNGQKSKLSKVGVVTYQNLCEKGTKLMEKEWAQSDLPNPPNHPKIMFFFFRKWHACTCTLYMSSAACHKVGCIQLHERVSSTIILSARRSQLVAGVTVDVSQNIRVEHFSPV